jgi:hypothetical protein
MALQHVENKTRDLRRQYREIIRQYDEEDTKEKSEPVLPEIFIERTKVFHSYKDTGKPEGKGQGVN